MLTFIPPRAGGMAFVRYRLPIASRDLAHRIRERKNVLTVPGEVFGLESYLRFGIGAPSDVLERGLARVKEVLDEVQRESASKRVANGVRN